MRIKWSQRVANAVTMQNRMVDASVTSVARGGANAVVATAQVGITGDADVPGAPVGGGYQRFWRVGDKCGEYPLGP